MNGVLKSFYCKPLVIYLALAVLALSTVAGPAEAMFMPAPLHQGLSAASVEAPGRAADLMKIQTALESKIISQKLIDYGLTPEETMARVNKLSDEQIHQIATHTDSLQAGGDAIGFIVGLAIIALLVVVLIYLVQGRIEIK